MIKLKDLDLEYTNYKKIEYLYNKYKTEFENFNNENQEELKSLLMTYNSIKSIKRNISRTDLTADDLIEDFVNKNPLFGKWYELDNKLKYYRNELEQYSSHTNAFTDCARFIALKHNEDDGFDLIDLYTQDKLDLSKYDESKKKYIINDLMNHHSFICYITQEDLPLLMQILEEIDQEIIFDENETEEEMEQKYWEKITRCHLIATEFEKRKNAGFDTVLKDCKNGLETQGAAKKKILN